MTDNNIVNFDKDRPYRTGIPEVILAEPKSNNELLTAISKALEYQDDVLLTRITNDQRSILEDFIKENSWYIMEDKFKRTMIIDKIEEIQSPDNILHVGIISAGTSDNKIVEETRLCLWYFGIGSLIIQDAGVAGLHRIKNAIDIIEHNPDIKILIVVAGQEGALFSVASSLTTLPIIAVPTSVGYGFGGKGETSLKSALQSCSPGITVVNIDNGFGAAVFATKLIFTLYIK